MTPRHLWSSYGLGIALLAGCVGDPSLPEVGERSAALTPVTWTHLVGASAAGNDLSKTRTLNAWNAGAVSAETLGRDGFVEFTTGEATTAKMAGLSHGNDGAGYADIDFAIRLSETGHVAIYEGGVNRGGVGTYVAGDLFRVQVQAGVVTYWKNGGLLYTSTGAAIFPLLVDSSLKTFGATLNDVAIEELPFWTDAIGAVASGNDLTKTAPEDLFNAGAVSITSIPAGDGYVEFRVADSTSFKAAGLSSGNSNQSRTDIDFAINLTDTGAVQIYENGTNRGNFGLYAPGDVFRVQVSGGVVTYLKNHFAFYSSLVAPTFPLLLDSSLRTPGSSIVDARMVVGRASEDCDPEVDLLVGSAQGEQFGEAVDAAGDVQVVGEPHATPPVAQVFRETAPGTWTWEQTLPRPPVSQPLFGARVATDGNTIVVKNSGSPTTRRSAEIFRYDGNSWVDEGLVEACPDDSFGLAQFAVRDDVLVGSSYPGRSYVFRRVDGTWTLEAVLPTGGGESSPVAIGGDRIFVVSPFLPPAGAVVVFRYMAGLSDPPATCDAIGPGKWRQKAVLAPLSPGELQGSDMDANAAGTRVVAGDAERNLAYYFELVGGTWSAPTTLTPYPMDKNWVGAHVAFGGPGGDSLIALGSNLNPDAHIFGEVGGFWTQLDTMPIQGEVAATEDSVFIGDDLHDGPFNNAGAVHVHGIDPVCYSE